MTARADRLRSRLADARLYLCIDARRHLDEQARVEGWTGEFPALRRDVAAALAGGVDIVQLRDKNSPGEQELGPLEAGHELQALATMREVCDEAGALLAVNDRADVAVAAGATANPHRPAAAKDVATQDVRVTVVAVVAAVVVAATASQHSPTAKPSF